MFHKDTEAEPPVSPPNSVVVSNLLRTLQQQPDSYDETLPTQLDFLLREDALLSVSKQDWALLAAVAIVMDAQEPNDDNTPRLARLLPYGGIDPNQPLEDLAVTFGNETITNLTLLEIAIQSNHVTSFRRLRQAGASLVPSLHRVLCTPLTEVMMVALEEALEEEWSTGEAPPSNFWKPLSMTIQTGVAWVGNLPDFETYYLQQKKQLDSHLEAMLHENDKQKCFPQLPVQNGDWIAVAPLPTLQVAFQVDCPDEYLTGALAGAMYGGFNNDNWNPLYPPVSEIIFTGRMAYSQEHPRHVTWFLDAIEPNQDETEFFKSLNAAALPNDSTLKRLRSIALVGTWNTTNNNHSSAVMWTCQQEYSYGIMAGGKVFISLGYEAMDVTVETMAVVMDTVLRAKLHYHNQTTTTQASEQKPFFFRTPFSPMMPNHLDRVPRKRTPTEIFEYRLEHGERFSGIEQLRRGRPPPPPQQDLRRFAPRYRIFDAATINGILVQHKFDCSMAKQLEDDVALLLDELVMMFLYAAMVPSLEKILLDGIVGNDVSDNLLQSLAVALFPNHNRKNSIDYQCYQRLIPSSETEIDDSTAAAQLKDGSGLSQEKLAELPTRLSVFLVDHLASSTAQLPILKDRAFLDRVYSVCEYLVLESLELANNGRRDSNFPCIVPSNVRLGVALDRELEDTFHLQQVMEFFYPANGEHANAEGAP